MYRVGLILKVYNKLSLKCDQLKVNWNFDRIDFEGPGVNDLDDLEIFSFSWQKNLFVAGHLPLDTRKIPFLGGLPNEITKSLKYKMQKSFQGLS